MRQRQQVRRGTGWHSRYLSQSTLDRVDKPPLSARNLSALAGEAINPSANTPHFLDPFHPCMPWPESFCRAALLTVPQCSIGCAGHDKWLRSGKPWRRRWADPRPTSAWGGWRRRGGLGRELSACDASQPSTTTFGTTARQLGRLGGRIDALEAIACPSMISVGPSSDAESPLVTPGPATDGSSRDFFLS